jgi:hypothetical protein
MKIRDVCEAMRVQIATIDGPPTYFGDLSQPGQVAIGWPAPTDVRPGRVWLLPGSVTSPRTRDEMTSSHRQLQVDILIAVASPSQNFGDRGLAVTDAVDSLMAVLDGWMPDPDQEWFEPVIEFPDLSGGEPGDYPVAVAVGTYTINWITPLGEGA